jgi:hypothetical protein
MSRFKCAVAVGAFVAVILALSVVPARAEDSGVFKNPADISRAQGILQAEGYLAPGSYTTGQLDHATRLAISRYQGRHSLNDSGTLDDDTYQTLLGHEVSYPWGDAETPKPVAAVAETPEAAPAPQEATPAAAPEPAAAVAEAPEAAPAPPAPEPVQEPARVMPATASPLPILVLAGLLLMVSGILVIRRRTA